MSCGRMIDVTDLGERCTRMRGEFDVFGVAGCVSSGDVGGG